MLRKGFNWFEPFQVYAGGLKLEWPMSTVYSHKTLCSRLASFIQPSASGQSHFNGRWTCQACWGQWGVALQVWWATSELGGLGALASKHWKRHNWDFDPYFSSPGIQFVRATFSQMIWLRSLGNWPILLYERVRKSTRFYWICLNQMNTIIPQLWIF